MRTDAPVRGRPSAKPKKPVASHTIIDDSPRRSFIDALADVFTPPQNLRLYQPGSNVASPAQDREHIAGYFGKLIKTV